MVDAADPLNDIEQLRAERDRLWQDILRREREYIALSEAYERATRVSINGGSLLHMDYVYQPHARDDRLAISLEPLRARLAAEKQDYIAFMTDAAALAPRFLQIAVNEPNDPEEPWWLNGWFPGLDGISLYAMLARHKPRRFLEVGSGNSTKFARRAIRDLGLATRIISIDPHPRAEIDRICDEVIRSPCEEVSLDVFRQLGSDDIVFIDNSHRSFPGSDVTVFFTEILPILPSGCIYGVHDIFLPGDYPPIMIERYYNEQYLLAMWLLGGAQGDRILMPVAHAGREPDILQPLKGVFEAPELPGIAPFGGTFWMQRS
jgi:hypothetical protein